jgi:hypothetical protein
MAQHIFQSESELQNNPEAAPKCSPTSFSISEKLARYGYRLGLAIVALVSLSAGGDQASSCRP